MYCASWFTSLQANWSTPVTLRPVVSRQRCDLNRGLSTHSYLEQGLYPTELPLTPKHSVVAGRPSKLSWLYWCILFLGKDWLAVEFCKLSQKRDTSLTTIPETVDSEYECMFKCLSVELCESLNYDTTARICEVDMGDQSSPPAELLEASDFAHYTVGHCSDASASLPPLQSFSSTIQYLPSSTSPTTSSDASTITSSTSTTSLYYTSPVTSGPSTSDTKGIYSTVALTKSSVASVDHSLFPSSTSPLPSTYSSTLSPAPTTTVGRVTTTSETSGQCQGNQNCNVNVDRYDSLLCSDCLRLILFLTQNLVLIYMVRDGIWLYNIST